MDDSQTNDRPILVDLFCCAGGASMGYHRAGFRVIGVDNEPRPNYPFEFLKMDALAALRDPPELLSIASAWSASPPCQRKCALTLGTNAAMADRYVDLYPETRELMIASGLPGVIENPDSRPDVVLCGEMFGLDVIRHRKFELIGWTMDQPKHLRHRGRVRGYRHGKYYDGPYLAAYGNGGGKASVAEMQAAMGIGWTDVREELTEAIPPAFTELIGSQLLDHIRA